MVLVLVALCPTHGAANTWTQATPCLMPTKLSGQRNSRKRVAEERLLPAQALPAAWNVSHSEGQPSVQP